MGIIAFRWASVTNDWIDAIILVNEDDREKTMLALKIAEDEFWAEGELDWCYMDFIHDALERFGIENSITIGKESKIDWDPGAGAIADYNYENLWEGFLNVIEKGIGSEMINIGFLENK